MNRYLYIPQIFDTDIPTSQFIFWVQCNLYQPYYMRRAADQEGSRYWQPWRVDSPYIARTQLRFPFWTHTRQSPSWPSLLTSCLPFLRNNEMSDSLSQDKKAVVLAPNPDSTHQKLLKSFHDDVLSRHVQRGHGNQDHDQRANEGSFEEWGACCFWG